MGQYKIVYYIQALYDSKIKVYSKVNEFPIHSKDADRIWAEEIQIITGLCKDTSTYVKVNNYEIRHDAGHKYNAGESLIRLEYYAN